MLLEMLYFGWLSLVSIIKTKLYEDNSFVFFIHVSLVPRTVVVGTQNWLRKKNAF